MNLRILNFLLVLKVFTINFRAHSLGADFYYEKMQGLFLLLRSNVLRRLLSEYSRVKNLFRNIEFLDRNFKLYAVILLLTAFSRR